MEVVDGRGGGLVVMTGWCHNHQNAMVVGGGAEVGLAFTPNTTTTTTTTTSPFFCHHYHR